MKCIREEGFAAASTRHIVERAGVSWGVIQYHFGDRDGLLTAVIDYGFDTMVQALNDLADTAEGVTDARARAETLSGAAWEIFSTPTAMGALEILIATRAMQGTMAAKKFSALQAALARIASLIDDSTPHARFDHHAALGWSRRRDGGAHGDATAAARTVRSGGADRPARRSPLSALPSPDPRVWPAVLRKRRKGA